MDFYTYDSWEIEPNFFVSIMTSYSGMWDINYYKAVTPPTTKRKIPANAAARMPPYTSSSCIETCSACYYMSGETQVTFYNTDTEQVETNSASRGWTDVDRSVGRAMFPDNNGFIINSYYGMVERICINHLDYDGSYDITFDFLDSSINSDNRLLVQRNSTTYVFVAKGSLEIEGTTLVKGEFGRITTAQTTRNVLLNYLEQDTILAIIHKKA